MLCSACKSDIPDSAKFCPKCGVAPKPAIATLAPTKHCPKCGTAHAIEAKFCKVDGYRFEQHEDPDKLASTRSAVAVVCPVCGTTNAAGAKFCKKDGVPLVTDASSVATPAPAPGPAMPQVLRVPQDPIYPEGVESLSPVPPRPSRQQTSTPARPAHALKWAVGVVILLALIAGGGGGYLYYTGEFISPADLKTTISSALVAKGIKGIFVNVTSDRVATISGAVDDAAIKDNAVLVARSVKGVKDVVSKLDVLPLISDTESRLSQTLKDQQLTEIQVKIDETRNATLTGNVSDAALIEVATKTATATLGVKSVTNQIQVVAIPAVTYTDRVEPQPSAAPQTAPRPSSSPKAKRAAVASRESTPVAVPVPPPAMAAPVPARAAPPAPPPVPAPVRQATTCDGTGGVYRLSCILEGPANYFRCAPDGRTWNHAIPGCDRQSAAPRGP